ncbi:MAG: ADOP family duplicated permease [Gemmatimonadales bacterium]
MSLRLRVFHWLTAVFRGRTADRELHDEMAFHLDQQARQLEAAGLTPAEARRQARLKFGSVDATREDTRDARGGRWLDDLRRDLSHAFRQFRRAPGFAAVTVATIGLGTGAATAIMSVLNGVLIRPGPFEAADRLGVLWQTDRRTGTTREPMSWPDFQDFRERVRGLAGLAAMTSTEMSLVDGEGDPIRLTAVLTTANYFDLVGVRPLLGRAYTTADDQSTPPRVALISEGLWRRRFGADRAVLGQTIRLDDGTVTVIGVLPAGTDFGLDQINARAAYHATYSGAGEVDVWAPLEATAREMPRDTHPILVLARLAPTATFASAGAEVAAIAADLEAAYPRSNAARGINLEALDHVVFGPIRPVLTLLVIAVALVLVVACVNVANLLLARGAARAREVAVRTALGAAGARLGRQFAVESMVLAVAGGGFGVLVAWVGLGALLRLAPADLPQLGQVRLDAAVLGASLALATVIGIGFGLVPSWQARRVDPISVMRNESRTATGGHSRLRRGLVVLELGLSVTLVITAALLVRSFAGILSTGPGFETAGLLKAQYQLPAGRYPRDYRVFPNWTEIQRFQRELLQEARRLPGATAVALANAHPLDAGFTNSFTIVGREAESADWPEISVRSVSAEYPATVGLVIRDGRGFADTDEAGAAPVALINEAAVQRFFPNSSPLGQQIRFWGIPRQIVGVVSDERIHGVTEVVPPAVYTNLVQTPSSSGVLVLRTSGEPTALTTAVRELFRRQDPALAVYGIEPLTSTLLGSVATRRFAMLVVGAFALVTMVLALIGIHGVLSFLAATRTREIGIRVALGASGASVRRLVLSDGATMVAAGVGIGVVGAIATSRLVAGLLYGVAPVDQVTYLTVAIGIAAAALLAMWLPVRSASRVAPTEALRAEG